MTTAFHKRAIPRLFVLLAVMLAAYGMTAAQDTETTYVTWTESNDAFAFDIPYGWTVDAYTTDVFGQRAPYVFVFAPEDRAVVMAGTPSSTLYLDSANYAQGEQVPLEEYVLTVSPYETPADYLENYLRTQILNTSCDTIFIVSIGDATPTDAESAASEISLECHFDGGYANGYFYLQTMSAEIENMGLMWMPTDFYGYLSEPEMEAQADAALDRMAATFVVNSSAPTEQNTPVTHVETPVAPTDDSGYDPDAFLQAQQELYQQQQTTAMISNMLQMQHETSMAIINNIGSSNTTYDYEWVWTP